MHIYIYKVNFFQNKLYTIKFFYNKIFIEYYVLFIYILRIIEELFNGYFYFFEILFKFPRMKLFVTKKKNLVDSPSKVTASLIKKTGWGRVRSKRSAGTMGASYWWGLDGSCLLGTRPRVAFHVYPPAMPHRCRCSATSVMFAMDTRGEKRLWKMWRLFLRENTFVQR